MTSNLWLYKRISNFGECSQIYFHTWDQISKYTLYSWLSKAVKNRDGLPSPCPCRVRIQLQKITAGPLGCLFSDPWVRKKPSFHPCQKSRIIAHIHFPTARCASCYVPCWSWAVYDTRTQGQPQLHALFEANPFAVLHCRSKADP